MIPSRLHYLLCFWLVVFLSLLGASSSGQDAQQGWTNSIGMQFVRIPSGSFMMGADRAFDRDAEAEESPRHQVTLTQPFYLGVHEVTQQQWQAVMHDNPSAYQFDLCPVERVSWNDAREFIRRLNAMEGTDRYRLPTEAEWEYAARAVAGAQLCLVTDAAALGQSAWYKENARLGPRPVGLKRPNAWGLYDMYGNVWEWVEDIYAPYSAAAVIDPQGSALDGRRVSRGCSWREKAWRCRATPRIDSNPDYHADDLGFRLAVSAE
jgi:formylglycine-generating enzyme required for sulfatase activity